MLRTRKQWTGTHAYGPNISTGAEPSLPEKIFRQCPKKNCYANLQNYFAWLNPPVIISKNPGFRALYLARLNEFRFFPFNTYNKNIFPFLTAGFCPKSLAFVRKIRALPDSGGCTPAPFLVRLWIGTNLCFDHRLPPLPANQMDKHRFSSYHFTICIVT